MLKKCQVVALPTEKAPNRGDLVYLQGAIDPWGIVNETSRLDSSISARVASGMQYHHKPELNHLYFTTDEEIKEGDWALHNNEQYRKDFPIDKDLLIQC